MATKTTRATEPEDEAAVLHYTATATASCSSAW